jgi:protein gp37
MGKTSIEWTDASWNPIVGCTEISPGCANCYAARLAATRLRNTPQYRDLAVLDHEPLGSGKWRPHWTGEVRFLPERLEEPLHWRKPRRIFVCDMGDLFHESVEDAWISEVFAIMASCQQHTFQVLTKRPARMQNLISVPFLADTSHVKNWPGWPLPNVWLGVSVENQHFADERIPLLLDTPAAVRWISAEPLLGPVDLDSEQENGLHALGCGDVECRRHGCEGIDWVVCGGESGPNARPMHPDWARSLRDQCHAAGVPFFFKQWGQWLHATQMEAAMTSSELDLLSRGTRCRDTGHGDLYFKVGKKRAGRQLDGSDWKQFPAVTL